jgi:hypothetical protein
MLRLTVAAAALALLCPSAPAVEIPLPPPEYSKPYRGQVRWRHVSLAEVQRLCGGFGVRAYVIIYACAVPEGTHCLVVMPKIGGPITREVWQRLRAHELGHCAGWPGDHPNPRWK